MMPVHFCVVSSSLERFAVANLMRCITGGRAVSITLTQKQEMVSELNTLAGTSISAIVADYRGLTVSDMTDLRKTAREARVTMRIYRNTLAKRALKETAFSCLEDDLVGPTVLFFAHDEPGAAARVLRDFTKSNETLEVKALAIDGERLAPAELKAMASLPSRDEALAQLMAQMMAPVTQLVRTLNEPAAQTVRVIAAIRDAKSE
jgi:large subunit ribosomal protein L10